MEDGDLVLARDADQVGVVRVLLADLKNRRGSTGVWKQILGLEESLRDTKEAGPSGSLGWRPWLCARRVCSVLHNQGKLLKWGEPEGEGKGEEEERSAAPPP